MKCIFSAQFKQLIKELFIVAIALSVLTYVIMFTIGGIGYISIHVFDFINFVTSYTSGPMDYYFRQGLNILLLLVVAIVALVSIYVLILHPIYFLIRYPKRVLNYIFDCKDRL